MSPAPNPKPPSRALGCIYLPFFLLGLFFLVVMVRTLIGAASTYTWQSVPCRIVASEVREKDNVYHPWFAFLRYAWSGGESERSSRSFDTYTDAVRYTRRWPAASTTTCYVDRADPEGALLERQGSQLYLALLLPLPLIFMMVGAVGFYGIVRRQPARLSVPRATHPIRGRRVGAVVLIFVGILLFMVFLLGPVRRAVRARSWQPRECTILRSGLLPHQSDEGGDTYTPAILYSYLVDGNEHRSDTYSFMNFSGGRSSADRTAGRYQAGSAVTCYVNPADPDDAVLHRGPTLIWLIGLAPLAAVATGLAIWPR